MINNDALVILSGGQDSTLCLGWALQNFDNVHAITFDYNQRHCREILAATDICRFFGVDEHEVIDSGDVLKSTSPLTSGNDLETYDSFDQMEKVIGDRVELTFVPMRNDYFLTVGANRAVDKKLLNLVTGVCEADNANYPDCRSDFIQSKMQTINLALGLEEHHPGSKFQIHTPLINIDKSESVRLGLTVPGVYQAWSMSHTAYDGNRLPIGRDHASVLRAEGFLQANIPDPLVAHHVIEGNISLPNTPNYEIMRERKFSSVDELAKAVKAETI